MQYALNYSGKDFCPLKTKIAQCPGGFRIKRNGKLLTIRPKKQSRLLTGGGRLLV